MSLTIASFNLYFFGESTGAHVERDEIDQELIARVIANVDADAIAFQEIHERDVLQRVLDRASFLRPGRRWVTSVPAGVMATATTPTASFQVVLAVDEARVSVEAVSMPLVGGNSRPPLIVDLEVEGEPMQLIAVHLKSGTLDEPIDGNNAARRLKECRRLREWLDANPRDRRVIIGDFNAFLDHPSLEPLRALPGWTWLRHLWPDGARRWTTHLDSFAFDPCAIDHVGLAPGCSADRLEVHCFDLSDELARDGKSWREWLATDDVDETNLRRVSDHRPVRATVQLNV